MIKTLLLTAALALAASPALAQFSGGGGSVSSVATTCPTSSNSPASGVVTIPGGVTAVSRTASGDTLVAGDCGSAINYTAGGSVTLTGAPTLGAGWFVNLSSATGNSTITITSGSGNFNITGTTTLTIAAGGAVAIVSDGTNFTVLRGRATIGANNALLTGDGAGGFGTAVAPGTGVATALGNAADTSGGPALVNGSPTSGNCLKWSASGVQDVGTTCGAAGINLTTGFQSGWFYYSPFSPQVGSGALQTVNATYCSPYVVTAASFVVKGVAVNVTTLDGSHHISFAIANSNGANRPGTLIDHTDSPLTTPAATVGALANGTDTLTAGTYFVCETLETSSTAVMSSGSNASFAFQESMLGSATVPTGGGNWGIVSSVGAGGTWSGGVFTWGALSGLSWGTGGSGTVYPIISLQAN